MNERKKEREKERMNERMNELKYVEMPEFLLSLVSISWKLFPSLVRFPPTLMSLINNFHS